MVLVLISVPFTLGLTVSSSTEIEQYKKALKTMFKKKEKRTVFFERNYRSQHLQVQVVPVPAEAALHLMEMFTVCFNLVYTYHIFSSHSNP